MITQPRFNVLLQLQFYNIFTNVLSIIFKSFHWHFKDLWTTYFFCCIRCWPYSPQYNWYMYWRLASFEEIIQIWIISPKDNDLQYIFKLAASFFTRYSLLVSLYFLLVTCFFSLIIGYLSLVTCFFLLVTLLITRYLFLLTRFFLLFTRYLPLVTHCYLLGIHYVLLVQYCIIFTMFTLSYTSVPEKEYRSVDIVCYDVDLIVFRLDFQGITNEYNCWEIIAE